VDIGWWIVDRKNLERAGARIELHLDWTRAGALVGRIKVGVLALRACRLRLKLGKSLVVLSDFFLLRESSQQLDLVANQDFVMRIAGSDYETKTAEARRR
jgi:hypothetical protein